MNNELIEKIEELKEVRTRLKCGEYDGIDIMRAWIAIDELIDCKAALTQQQEAEPYGYLRENDGAVQLSIVPHKPADRSSGYATPWAAIYTHPPKPAAQPVYDSDGCVHTGNAEADEIINRLNSSDPEFEDCSAAVALIYKLVSEMKAPDGFATWKDAAIAERVKRLAQPQVPEGYQLVPVEPTNEMVDAAWSSRHPARIWELMLSAAKEES